MTHPGVDLSAIGSENRRMTQASIPAGSIRSDRVRPAPVTKNSYRLQLCRTLNHSKLDSLNFQLKKPDWMDSQPEKI